MITKKPQNNIVHYEIPHGRYLCNQAVETFPEKRTIEKDKVTCMNCLRALNMKHAYNGMPPNIDLQKVKEAVEKLPDA